MKRILGTFFAVYLAISTLVTPALAVQAGGMLRVGLHYGTGALAAPQLQNFEGSGYQAGYFDEATRFSALFPIAETKVAVLKDAGYRRNDGNTYEETQQNPTVGAYHVQLEGSYPDAISAQATADAMGGFVAYVDGTYYVRKGSFATLAQAQAAGGGTAVGGSTTGVTVVATETGNILFEYDGDSLFAMAPQGDKPITWCKGYKYYGSFAYQRVDGGNLSVINYVDIEDYVKGVIPYEMSASWPAEALKAQAVCARSEAATTTKHAKLGFDVCATTDCQVYRGTNLAGESTDKAAEETAGVYATVDGKPVGLFYFSSDGGATEDAVNVWGGQYSYLVGKLDPYEASVVPEKNASWSVTMTAEEAAVKIRAADASFGKLSSLAVTKLTAVGNVLEVTATDTSGKSVVISKAKCRSVFGLDSQRYAILPAGVSAPAAPAAPVAPSTIGGGILAGFKKALGESTQSGATQMPQKNDIVTGAASYTFKGSGWGHHVGMSQYGAKAMAEQGKSFEDILNFYFTGISLSK